MESQNSAKSGSGSVAVPNSTATQDLKAANFTSPIRAAGASTKENQIDARASTGRTEVLNKAVQTSANEIGSQSFGNVSPASPFYSAFQALGVKPDSIALEIKENLADKKSEDAAKKDDEAGSKGTINFQNNNE